MVVTHVVGFLGAVNTPSLMRYLEFPETLFCKAITLEGSNYASSVGSTFTGSDSLGIGD